MCVILQGAFSWVAPACRWSKEESLRQLHLTRLHHALRETGAKLTDVALRLRHSVMELENADLQNEAWWWRMKELGAKIEANIRLAQTPSHIKQTVSSGLLLLREYLYYLESRKMKLLNDMANRISPIKGLQACKKRMRKRAQQRRERDALHREMVKRRLEYERADREKCIKLRKEAQERVHDVRLTALHNTISVLTQKVEDPDILHQLQSEFLPGAETNIATADAYVYTLKHVISIESRLAVRNRRKEARNTCRKTLKRVRYQRHKQWLKMPHCFDRKISRLIEKRVEVVKKKGSFSRRILTKGV